MPLALSTRWNAGRHISGEEMIDEILRLGFRHVELGYDLRADLVPGVRKMVEAKSVGVDSVHNFCPVPVGAPFGHPELYLLTSLRSSLHESAVQHTINTVRFAAEIGARFVVVHAGHVDMRNLTNKLVALWERGRQFTDRYERIKLKLMERREKHAGKHLDALYRAIEKILPVLQDTQVRLALENLPTWESVPSEVEMMEILRRFNTPLVCYWHDIGHAHVRDRLGFSAARLWIEKLAPSLGGMHVHDAVGAGHDHLMPPLGEIDFAALKAVARSGIVCVLEPTPSTPVEHVQEGLRVIGEVWDMPASGGGMP